MTAGSRGYVMVYKPFHTLRTVVYAAFTCFLVVFGAVFPASAEPYMVEGIQVDVTADNALNARNQAFTQAQQEAFKALAAQFLPEENMAAFQPPDPSVISGMIQDYEVTQEKLSSRRYIGTYTFRFREKAVHRYFPDSMEFRNAAETAGLSTEQSPPPRHDVEPSSQAAPGPADPRLSTNGTLLVLPFLQQGRSTYLWSPSNTWMQAWQRARPSSGQVLPIGEIADVSDIGDDQPRSYDNNKLVRMMGRYDAGEAAIAIATPDLDLAQSIGDTTPAYGSLRVDLYRTDRGSPEYTGQVLVTASGSETISQVFDRAVTQVQQKLQGTWKLEEQQREENQDLYARYSPSAATPAVNPAAPVLQGNKAIEARVKFKNLQEWAAVQRALSRVPGLGDVVLKSLAPREARIGLVFEGNPESLKLALQQQDLDLAQAGESYNLSLMESDAQILPSDNPVYTPPYSRTFGAPQIPRPYANRF
ncbi:MAG: hypothetical protein IT558_04470 [Alphaproteobacteria bacterium]|nr:hypothetical protein [Alphaproteobacteria bacterium]